MIIPLLISTIVVFILFSINFLPMYGCKRWITKSPLGTFLLSLYLIVAAVFSPIGGDKERYIDAFKYASLLEYNNDSGWTFLTKILNILCLNNEILYLFVLALVYVFSYYYIGKCKLGKQHVAYYLLLSAGCLGFWSGSTNIIRAGFATSLFFMSLCFEEKKKSIYVAFSLFAIMVHNSVIVLVAAFFLTKYYQKFKVYVWIWLTFLAFSSVNALNPIVSFLSSHTGEVGDRVALYAYNIDQTEADNYGNSGFRIDFILYSALAIIYSGWIIIKQKYDDVFYMRLSCTYIIVNCLWLVMIRVTYADRFALLSWSLISLIILYPYMNPYNRLPFNKKVITVAFIPVVLELVLMIRS